MLLEHKAAVVTGAGQGIGLALVKGLAAEGCQVVVNDIQTEKAEKVAEEIRASGGRAIADTTDISTFAGADKLVEGCVRAFSKIDIMVNNAGILRDRMSFNMSEEEWNLVINVCLRGTFACARAAIRAMRSAGQGGRIINVTSRSGLRGSVGQANYAAAKAGVAGLTRTLCQEVSKYNITVNAICPRAKTGMTASVPTEVRQRKDALGGGGAVVRTGAPEQIAPLVVYLASDESAGINGQVFGIGGDKLSLWSHPREVTEAFIFGGWDVTKMRELLRTSVGFELQSVGNKD
jgi:NAD(P)-dependent dehydrogenase (short-subunit alcohol dehydrogenase family)